MTLEELLSFPVAALAAMGNALANVMQRKASLEESPDQPFGLRLLADLVRSPTWLIGFGGMVGSFALQAVALGLGPLSAVEPVITLEVPLTLLVASRVFRTSLGRSEWLGVLAMTVGMIALVAVLDPRAGNDIHVTHGTYLAAGGGTALTIAALVLGGQRGTVFWRTACLGAAAGTSFGLTATMIKDTISNGEDRGLVGVLAGWQTYVVVGFGIFGVVLMQWALHTGPLLAAQPGFTLMDPLVSILWGVLVFDEPTRTGPIVILAAVGAIGVGYGVRVLARSPLFDASRDTASEPGSELTAHAPA